MLRKSGSSPTSEMGVELMDDIIMILIMILIMIFLIIVVSKK